MEFTAGVVAEAAVRPQKVYPLSPGRALAAGSDPGFADLAADFTGYLDAGRIAGVEASGTRHARRIAPRLLDETALARRAAELPGEQATQARPHLVSGPGRTMTTRAARHRVAATAEFLVGSVLRRCPANSELCWQEWRAHSMVDPAEATDDALAWRHRQWVLLADREGQGSGRFACGGRAYRPVAMTRQYLIGELSLHLQRLQAVASQAGGRDAALDIAGLRRQAEAGGVPDLGLLTNRALALADGLCWESLASGDTAAFSRQAEISADLRLFGTSSRLLEDT